MSTHPSPFEPPQLLVATPRILDPHFFRSVVLLTHHTEDSSLGVIVNRPTEIPVRALLENTTANWLGDPSATAWFGGPVETGVGLVIFRNQEDDGPEQVDVSLDLGILDSISGDELRDVRLMLGYCGWGPSQLGDELARNDWIVTTPEPDLIFGDPKEVWRAAMEASGAAVDSVSWVQPGSEVN